MNDREMDDPASFKRVRMKLSEQHYKPKIRFDQAEMGVMLRAEARKIKKASDKAKEDRRRQAKGQVEWTATESSSDEGPTISTRAVTPEEWLGFGDSSSRTAHDT